MASRKSPLLLVLLIFVTQLWSQKVTHFDLEVEIDMMQKKVAVSGYIDVDFEGRDTIILTLNKNTHIYSIKGEDQGLNYLFDTSAVAPMYIPLGRDLLITKTAGSPDMQAIRLTYESNYQDLGGWANSFQDNWVELNLYCAWFPTNYASGSFTADLKVTIDNGYGISGSGLVSQDGNTWFMEQPWPAFDIILIASNDLHHVVVAKEESTFETVYNDFSDAAADSVIADCDYALRLFQSLFGKADSTYLKFVISPFEKGGGYSRKNFIVMRTLKYDIHTQGGIAHEMAHFWWRNADVTTWEDWLNEAFAEYSMLIYFRERLGQKVFEDRLQLYREKVKETPPIYNIDRNSSEAYYVLYYKGALILHQLKEKMGAGQFYQFLSQVSENKIGYTTDLLSLLEKEFSYDLSVWLDNMLKTE